MAFLCPARLKKEKKKDQNKISLPVGRITGSSSLDTLTQAQAAKQSGAKARMIIVQDFEPCVSDEVRVKRGEHVKVLYQENDWLYVLTADEEEGFVPYNYCLPQERSVDDFYAPERSNVERQHKCIEKTGPKEPSVSDTECQKQTQSVPDIAWNCDLASRGSRLQGNWLNSSVRSDSGLGKVQVENMPNHHSRCSAQSFPVKNDASTGSLDKRNYASFAVKCSRKSSLTAASVHSVNITRSFSANNGLTGPKHDDHSHHIYVNDDVMSNRWIGRQHHGNKPDILPTSNELTNCSGDSMAGQFGVDWKNMSTRSAPESWSIKPTSRITGQQLEYHKSHPSTKRQEEICYTTAKVTSDLFRAGSQPNISVFSKSNKGQYLVLYDFEKQDEDDLNVRQGEFITVLNTDDLDWFWVINKQNEEGFVPASYITLAEEVTSSFRGVHGFLSSTHHSRSRSLPVTSQHDVHKSLDKKGSFQDLTQSIKLVCLYSYIAESEEHLSISRGDWLYADYNSQPNEDWLWVYSPRRRRSGYVPRSYVKAPNFGYQRPSAHNGCNVSNVRAVSSTQSRKFNDPYTSP